MFQSLLKELSILFPFVQGTLFMNLEQPIRKSNWKITLMFVLLRSSVYSCFAHVLFYCPFQCWKILQMKIHTLLFKTSRALQKERYKKVFNSRFESAGQDGGRYLNFGSICSCFSTKCNWNGNLPYTPAINMESKHHPFKKENHLNRTSIGKGSMWIFQGVSDPKQVPQSHNTGEMKGQPRGFTEQVWTKPRLVIRYLLINCHMSFKKKSTSSNCKNQVIQSDLFIPYRWSFFPLKRVTWTHHPKKVTAWITRKTTKKSTSPSLLGCPRKLVSG